MLTEEAIKRIQETFQIEPQSFTFDDREWLVKQNGLTYQEIVPNSVDCLGVSTLSGLVDYLKDSLGLSVWIKSYNDVQLISSLDPVHRSRDTFIQATAIISKFSFGQYSTMDELIIALMAHFHETTLLNDLLNFVSNVQSEEIHKNEDDGVGQKVSVKKSLTTLAVVPVPNPVKLMPYLTFPEVDDFEVSYIFRMKKGREGEILGALFETGSITWKRDCIEAIRDYIVKAVPDVKIIY